MRSENTDIFGTEVFSTRKRPLYFYITVTLWTILLVGLLAIIKIKDLQKGGIVAAAIIFLGFAIYCYVLFGRYLANITLYQHQIKVSYLFPWNKTVEFQFDKLTAIEFREFDLVDRFSRHWYRGGKRLYIKDGVDNVCQFKYTINVSDNRKLLQALQERCSTGIACS
jgi:hypothetical protein